MKNLIEKIQSWNDVALEYKNPDETDLPFSNPKNDSQLKANAHWRIMQTVKLFKQGDKCNYAPANGQSKYFAWMAWSNDESAVVFSPIGMLYDGTAASVGPHLTSLSKESAEHIVNIVCREDYITYYNE